MKQHVDKIEFWKDRIDRVAKDNVPVNYSVYIAHGALWNQIAKVHEKIVREHCVGMKVLDAGCGYGRVSEWVENYTGVDFSPDFVDMARKQYPTKDFIVADLADMPFFDDKDFDVVVVISIKQMIVGNLGEAAWDAMEKELRRVGKKILLLEYTTPEVYDILT